MLDQSAISNKLLSTLSKADFDLLRSGLAWVELVRSQILVESGEPIEYCWFLEDGIASIVVTTPDGHEAEAGIVGSEGMVDVATVLGVAQSPLRSFMQIPGAGYRIPVRALTAAYEARPSLRAKLNSFAFSILTQVAHTALVNASFSIEERLARWLLLCGDRLAGEEIAMTHEFLALMLNVRRAGVTTAMQTLIGAGLLSSRRGAIRISDRQGLELFANDAYSAMG